MMALWTWGLFDLFDETPHTESPLIDEKARAMRRYFKQGMEDVGFKNYSKEWWHFTLVHELFLETYFSFPIRPAASAGPHF
jgi:D-alanyl-D-alanine dipeptidase